MIGSFKAPPLNAVKDLLTAFNGGALKEPITRPSIEELFRDRHGHLLDGKSLLPTAGELEKIQDSSRRLLWRSFANDVPKVTWGALDTAQTKAIVERSRREGTTVHGALCAALVTATAKSSGSVYSIVSPINIRSLVEISDLEIGVFLTVAPILYSKNRASRFWDIARYFSDNLKKFRSVEAVAEAVERLEQVLPMGSPSDVACGLVGSLAYDAVVSNLGVVENTSNDRKVRLGGLWGPMVLGRIRNERMFGAVTFDGALRLTEARPEHLPTKVQDVIAQLADAC